MQVPSDFSLETSSPKPLGTQSAAKAAQMAWEANIEHDADSDHAGNEAESASAIMRKRDSHSMSRHADQQLSGELVKIWLPEVYLLLASRHNTRIPVLRVRVNIKDVV